MDVQIDCSSIYFGLQTLKDLEEEFINLSASMNAVTIKPGLISKSALFESAKNDINNATNTTIHNLVLLLEQSKQILQDNDREAALLFACYEDGVLTEDGKWVGVPLMNQDDYGDIKYSQGSVKTSGCGLTSLCMVATYITGQLYTPEDLAAIANADKSSNVGKMTTAADYVGLNWYKNSNTSREDLKALLAEGKMVICLVKGSTHFVLCTGLAEDGQIIVNDPYSPFRQESHKDGYTWEELQFSAGNTWVFDPSQNTSAKTTTGVVSVNEETMNKLADAGINLEAVNDVVPDAIPETIETNDATTAPETNDDPLAVMDERRGALPDQEQQVTLPETKPNGDSNTSSSTSSSSSETNSGRPSEETSTGGNTQDSTPTTPPRNDNATTNNTPTNNTANTEPTDNSTTETQSSNESVVPNDPTLEQPSSNEPIVPDDATSDTKQNEETTTIDTPTTDSHKEEPVVPNEPPIGETGTEINNDTNNDTPTEIIIDTDAAVETDSSSDSISITNTEVTKDTTEETNIEITIESPTTDSIVIGTDKDAPIIEPDKPIENPPTKDPVVAVNSEEQASEYESTTIISTSTNNKSDSQVEQQPKETSTPKLQTTVSKIPTVEEYFSEEETELPVIVEGDIIEGNYLDPEGGMIDGAIAESTTNDIDNLSNAYMADQMINKSTEEDKKSNSWVAGVIGASAVAATGLAALTAVKNKKDKEREEK